MREETLGQTECREMPACPVMSGEWWFIRGGASTHFGYIYTLFGYCQGRSGAPSPTRVEPVASLLHIHERMCCQELVSAVDRTRTFASECAVAALFRRRPLPALSLFRRPKQLSGSSSPRGAEMSVATRAVPPQRAGEHPDPSMVSRKIPAGSLLATRSVSTSETADLAHLAGVYDLIGA